MRSLDYTRLRESDGARSGTLPSWRQLEIPIWESPCMEPRAHGPFKYGTINRRPRLGSGEYLWSWRRMKCRRNRNRQPLSTPFG